MKVNETIFERELQKLNYGDLKIVTTPETVTTVLDNARILANHVKLQDTQLVEKILNLPIEQQNEIIWQLNSKPGIDIELAANTALTPAQFREHMDIANYNYNVDYGHMKDTGKIAIDHELIKNPNLTSQQLYIIHHTTADNLSPDKLFLPDGQPLSEQEMAHEFIAQTENRAEVNVKLEEMGISPFKLQPFERQYLNNLHYEGKSQSEQNNKFNQIINSEEIKDNQLRSVYLAKMKEPAEKEQPGIINRIFAKLDIIKSQIFKTPDQEQSDLDTIGHEYNTKFKKVMIDGKDGYYQSSDKSINIHEDSIEVAKLSPKAVDLAIAATVAKFGNNIQVSGSDEFKQHVLTALTTNDKFKAVSIDDPELQAKLTTLREEQEQSSIINEANTLSAGNRVIENEPFENKLVTAPENSISASAFYEKILQDIEKSNYSPEEKDFLKFRADEMKQPLLSFPEDQFFNEELQRDLFDIDHLVYSYRTDLRLREEHQALTKSLGSTNPELKTADQFEVGTDPLKKLEANAEKIEELSYLHSDPLVEKWLNEGRELIKPKENAGLVRDYFMLEYGVANTKNDINKLENSEEYKIGNRDSVSRHEFLDNHLNNVENRLREFYSSGKLTLLNDTFQLRATDLKEKTPLDYKSMIAPLDRHGLIEPANLLQLISNANHNTREYALSQQQAPGYQKFAPTEIEDLDKAEIGKQHLSVFENDDYLFVVAYDNKEELRKCFDDLQETLPESILQELNKSKENDSLEEFIEKLAEAHEGKIHSIEDYIEKQNQNERD